MKRCSKCGAQKEINEFKKDSHAKSGLSSWCKECSNKNNRRYSSENKDKVQEGQKKWRHENREKANMRQRKWRVENPEKYKSNNKKWKQWQDAHPGSGEVRNSNNRSNNIGIAGRITAQEWEALKKHYDHTCLACNRQEPEIKLTLDHVVPLILGGRNEINNVQPLCKSCNSSKGTDVIDFRYVQEEVS